MTKAQTAWAVLTGMLIVAAVVLFAQPTVSNTTAAIAGSICLGFGLLGWFMLGGMILTDSRADREQRDG